MITKFLQYLTENKIINPIQDVDIYIDGLNKGIKDKLFFLNMINANLLVDFGCSDGTILNKINEIKPNIKLIGYDVDSTMYSRNNNPNIYFTDNWFNVKSQVLNYNGKKTILCSSVIHEVYSYSSTKEVKDFWENKLFGGLFDYIVIRDMMPSTKYDKFTYDKWSHNNIKNSDLNFYLTDFENRWGKITDSFRHLLHFLLKYKYRDNWQRENNENYVPISIETLKKKIPSNYKIVYEDHFLPDFLKNEIKNDFNIDINEPTHIKIIIKKNG